MESNHSSREERLLRYHQPIGLVDSIRPLPPLSFTTRQLQGTTRPVAPQPPSEAMPRPSYQHIYNSQNHQYYSKDHDHGIQSQSNLRYLDKSGQPLVQHQTLVSAVCPATESGPAKIDEALEDEYVAYYKSRGLPPPTYVHQLMRKQSEVTAQNLTREAMAARRAKFQATLEGTLDRHLADNIKRLKDEADGIRDGSLRAGDLSTRSHPSAVQSDHTQAVVTSSATLVLHGGEELLMEPTAFELRRLHQQQAPPLRSVKAVAERKRKQATVLISTKRIIEPLPEGVADPPRKAEQRLRTTGYSEIDKWKIKMGLLTATEVCPTYADKSAPSTGQSHI